VAVQLRSSWLPGALKIAPRRFQLGQAAPISHVIIVVDHSGRPVSGVQLSLLGTGGREAVTATTDGEGKAVFQVEPGNYEVQTSFKGIVLAQSLKQDQISRGLTTFVQLPFCVVDPIVRPVDLVILGGAAAFIAAGSYWKVQPLTMVGEIAIGAAIFSLIYRLQCL